MLLCYTNNKSLSTNIRHEYVGSISKQDVLLKKVSLYDANVFQETSGHI